MSPGAATSCRAGRSALVTDPLAVVQAATSTSLDRSSACGLVWELKDLLVSNFASRTISHNPRQCNSVAYGPASLGASMGPCLISVRDDIPSCIHVLVANDLTPVDE